MFVAGGFWVAGLLGVGFLGGGLKSQAQRRRSLQSTLEQSFCGHFGARNEWCRNIYRLESKARGPARTFVKAVTRTNVNRETLCISKNRTHASFVI